MNTKKKIVPVMAFTLVELLAVIAVIGILVALLIPVLSSVRSQARRAEDSANLRSVMLAARLYANDNKGKFPVTDDPASGVRSATAPTGLMDQLLPYCSNAQSFYCSDVLTGSYSFNYQNTLTTNRFRQMGYYWLCSSLSTKDFGAAPPLPQTIMGDPNRVMMVDIYNVGGAKPFGGNYNIAFADAHVRPLGQGKEISTATVNFSTLLLKQ